MRLSPTATVELTEHVRSKSPAYDETIVRSLVDKIWATHRYIQGSTTKESPYEIEFCLRPAISEWLPGEFLLATALTEERDFHLHYGDPWDYVAKTIPEFEAIPDSRLIFVGVPRLYKYLPLFCSALFHELGRFIDLSHGLTNATMLLNPPNPEHAPILENYRREYFADLFAASYVGGAIADTLSSISPDAGVTFSHPSTASRLELIEDYLVGNENGEIDMWQDVLRRREQPSLKRRFELPEIKAAFDDIRPVAISEDAHLFGLFPAAWSYMTNAIHGDGPDWANGAGQLEIVRIVNDLTEKSIRNASVRKLWQANAS